MAQVQSWKTKTIRLTLLISTLELMQRSFNQRYPMSFEKCNQIFWIKKCETVHSTAPRPLAWYEIDRIHKALFGKAYLEVRKKIKALQSKSSDFSFLSK